MMWKKTLFLPLMAAAIGGPLLFFAGEDESESDTDSKDEVVSEVELTGFESAPQKIYQPPSDLGAVFDFKLTPEAFENRWKDVTKSAANGTRIYRASMISGHGPQDPVGALTYRFTQSGRLKAIQFSGYVANPENLVRFVTGKFGFARTDETGKEYRPTAFSGHSGSLKLEQSREYQNQFKVELEIGR